MDAIYLISACAKAKSIFVKYMLILGKMKEYQYSHSTSKGLRDVRDDEFVGLVLRGNELVRETAFW